MAPSSGPNCSVLHKHAWASTRAPVAQRSRCLEVGGSELGLLNRETLPAVLRTGVCASVSLLPESSSESFCTVFWQAVSESMDDSLAQFVRRPDGTSATKDGPVAALVTFGNGSARNLRYPQGES
jgi:hypothetical protein